MAASGAVGGIHPHLSSHSKHHHHPLLGRGGGGVRANQAFTVEPPLHRRQKSSLALNLPAALSNLLHLNLDAHTNKHSIEAGLLNIGGGRNRPNTPTASPKEDISAMWREIHGSTDWVGLLDLLHPWLRREIVKYGEFAQATYDAFDFDALSEYCGSCRYSRRRLFDKLGLGGSGYGVTKYVYAMSHVELPRWLERSLHTAETWSRDSNWMGYVAVSDDRETRRIGRRDIVVAWRGTIAPSEWFEDLQGKLEPMGGGGGDGDVKVEHGFHSIYTSKSESTWYNKSSASEQVMAEIERLVDLYRRRGEEVSLTVTGHSLGGALALLNAHEAAATIPDLPVSVVSFGAPRVGNAAFRDELHRMGVKTLRVVNKQDLVPKLPGILFNEKFAVGTSPERVYTHVGVELSVDVGASPYLKHGGFDLPGFHSLETYLHLVDGHLGGGSGFRADARRDVALVNKASGMLRKELRVPECWHQSANKGLVCNAYGRWVLPERSPEDVPSPYRLSPTPCY